MTGTPPPNVHIRVFLTWCAIFPLVTLASLALEPIAGGWHPVLRALVLTAVVVPVAVYLVVPRLLRLYGWWRMRRGPAGRPAPSPE